jgi:HK97 family phage major capsid protein
MATKYLTPTQQELRSLFNEADELSRRSEQTKQTEARNSFIYARIKALQSGNAAGDVDLRKQFFDDLFSTREVRDVTPMEAGTQSITYTAGSLGGYLVPQEFHDEVLFGMSQNDPLLDKNIVTLIESADGALRPYTIPGWDLSTFSAVKVNEGAQHPAQAPPTVSGTILNGFKYVASLPITMELEQDMFEATQGLMSRAYSTAFARGIGADLAVGDGATGPQGIVNAPNVFTTASPTAIVLNDIEGVYFKLNRFHRAAPKCAWAMNDAVYQLVRKAVDTVGNPLLKVIHDRETLMGKPVYVTPSLPAYNASLPTQSNGSFCVFGNLEQLFVRVSHLSVTRSRQAAGYAEYGKALYTGIMRADSKIFDPTAGSVPPIVSARLHA